MGDAVEQGACEPLGAEDLGLLVEGKIAGDQGRGALVSLADGLEEQLGAGLGEWHITEFIDDQQLLGGKLFLEAPQVLFVPSLDQFADQSGGGEEADAVAALAAARPSASAIWVLPVPLLPSSRMFKRCSAFGEVRKLLNCLERETGIEPATFSLGRRRSIENS